MIASQSLRVSTLFCDFQRALRVPERNGQGALLRMNYGTWLKVTLFLFYVCDCLLDLSICSAVKGSNLSHMFIPNYGYDS